MVIAATQRRSCQPKCHAAADVDNQPVCHRWSKGLKPSPMRGQLENGLLLNLSKSEAFITGSRHHVQSFDITLGLYIAGSTVPFVNNIRLLEVAVDSQCRLINTTQLVVRSCNYHIRSLRHVTLLIDR